MDAFEATSSPEQLLNPKRLHGDGRVAHTLTACCRCRRRKTRCDAHLPRCSPCERNNAICEYFDVAKGKNMPRDYVVYLQQRVRDLEAELSQVAGDGDSSADAEVLVRGAGFVRIKENDEEPRFLGPSSGIAMTRLIMELAKDLYKTTSIKEIVPEKKAQEIRDRFAKEALKPTSKAYPLISSVAAPNLPSLELTERLIDNFNLKLQSLYPILHEPSFRQVVRDVYNGSADNYQNFTLRMTIAISMQKLDTQYAGLADSYYLAALPFLENTIRAKNVGTLQCFALIAQYSATTPTRTAAYWVVGLATKLCQEMGLTEEATITCDDRGEPLDTLEVDLRRRLFWIIASMELGLAHSLGRPSALGISHDHIDIKPFLTVDDIHITRQGIHEGSQQSMKKCIALHFMKMRLLQLEIRKTLYMRKRPHPKNDCDPWFKKMEAKIRDWIASSPRYDEGSGLSKEWFHVRYNTMVVFLYRPSPQVPNPSVTAAQLCFDASKYNIYVQRKQIYRKSVDVTWIFTQSLFMAMNTLLWSLSYSEIRKMHPRNEVEQHLHMALEAIYLTSIKWPGVESALELYTTLVEACIKAYDGGSDRSYSIGPPNGVVRALPRSLDSSTYLDGVSEPQVPSVSPELALLEISPQTPEKILPSNDTRHTLHPNEPDDEDKQSRTLASPLLSPEKPTQGRTESVQFDPSPYQNPLPSPLATGFSGLSWDSMYDQDFLMSSIDGQHSQYLIPLAIPQQPQDGLNLEQQSELMSNLESNGLAGLLRETSPADYFVGIGR